MKRYITILAAVGAAFATASCSSEKLTPEVSGLRMVTKTFSAEMVSEQDGTPSLKTAIGEVVSDKQTIVWEGNEKIAVYAVNGEETTGPYEFSATASGAKTSFTGTVPEGATAYYAVYPYSAVKKFEPGTFSAGSGTYTGSANVEIPHVQRAVSGTFDPSAMISVAMTSDLSSSLKFWIACAMLRFRVDESGISAVRFYSDTDNMSGTMRAMIREGASPSPGANTISGTVYPDVIVKAPSGESFQSGTDYYAVVRPQGSYSGFKADLVKADYSAATKESSNALSVSRAHILPLGTISLNTWKKDLYKAYMAALDLEIAGESINLETYGAANLPASGALTASSFKNGVNFFDPDNTYSLGSVSLTSDQISLNRYPDSKVTFSCSNVISLKAGSSLFHGIHFDAASSEEDRLFNNGGASADYSRLAFSACSFNFGSSMTQLYRSAATAYAITDVLFESCSINVKGTTKYLINPHASHTAAYNFKRFVFRNNYVYNNSSSVNVQVQIFVYGGANVSGGDWDMEGTIENNLFYNTVHSGGILLNYDIASYSVKNNLLYDGASSAFHTRIFGLKNAAYTSSSKKTYALGKDVASDNYAYGLDGSHGWRLADDIYRGSGPHPTRLDASFLDAVNLETGSFTVNDSYAAYGPQL